MNVRYDRGIHAVIDKKHILFDPTDGVSNVADLVIVSHGHWDHASGLSNLSNKTIILHPATYEYKKKYIKKSNKIIFIKSADETHNRLNGIPSSVKINGFTIEAHRSAHCVGALQFKIRSVEKSIVFTGDINLSGTITEPPAKILKGDILITEANFGHPDYIFPNRYEMYQKLLEWIQKYKDHKPIILFTHALGKTQELTQLLNRGNLVHSSGNGSRCNLFMGGLNVETNTLFERYRHRFDNRYKLFTKAVELQQGEFLLYPIREKISMSYLHDVKEKLAIDDAAFAYISGWTLKNRGSFNFPISSHSGFDELMKYITESNPEKVFTFHGFAETLARHTREKGIFAKPITEESSFE